MNNDLESCAIFLEQGLEQLAIKININLILQYLFLLDKWNRRYNLTAIRSFKSMITHHILDSLLIYPWVSSVSLLDVGSGAGLPGIPLAMAREAVPVTLVESNTKKVHFLYEVRRQLSLNNIEIIHGRVEQFNPALPVDMIVSRAFTNIPQLLQWTKHLLVEGGAWLVMKGKHPKEELATVSFPYKVLPYSVPGIAAERCCVLIKRLKEEELDDKSNNNSQSKRGRRKDDHRC